MAPGCSSVHGIVGGCIGCAVPRTPTPGPIVRVPSVRLGGITSILTFTRGRGPISSSAPLAFRRLGRKCKCMLCAHRFGRPVDKALRVPKLHSCTIICISNRRMKILGQGAGACSVRVRIPFGTALRVLIRGVKHVGCNDRVMRGAGKVVDPIRVTNGRVINK